MALNRFRMRPGSKPERRDRIRSKSPDFSGKKVELVYAVSHTIGLLGSTQPSSDSVGFLHP